jgi:hypothetical protein
MKTKSLPILIVICSWILPACQSAHIPPTTTPVTLTTTPIPINTPEPIATIEATITNPGLSSNYFTEEFNNETKNWQSDGAGFSQKIENGQLVVELDNSSIDYPHVDFYNDHYGYSDVRIDMSVTNIANNGFGVKLICRHTDAGHYMLSFDYNWYRIQAYRNGQWDVLYNGNFDRNYIKNTTNILTFICKGNTLSILVNGVEGGSFTDNRFSDGTVGFGIAPPFEGWIFPIVVGVDFLTTSAP